MSKKNMLDRFSVTATESLPRKSLVELWGTERVIIEVHKGICQYSDDKIVVNGSYGSVVIYGVKLKIMRMTKEQIVICGNIQNVTLERK